MDNPSEIYKQSDNNYLIITELTDNNNNPIIIPIQINGKGTYNNLIIDENQISSVYGRKNLDNYISSNKFSKIYEKNRTTLNEGVKSHDISNSIKYSISNSESNVNNLLTNNTESQEGSFNLPKNTITQEDLKLTNTNQSLTTTLLDWFYDEPKIVESLTYWIDLYYRGEKKVYLADEKLFHKIQEKQKDFYSLDDLFFMEYKDIMIVFLLGNNE